MVSFIWISSYFQDFISDQPIRHWLGWAIPLIFALLSNSKVTYFYPKFLIDIYESVPWSLFWSLDALFFRFFESVEIWLWLSCELDLALALKKIFFDCLGCRMHNFLFSIFVWYLAISWGFSAKFVDNEQHSQFRKCLYRKRLNCIVSDLNIELSIQIIFF